MNQPNDILKGFSERDLLIELRDRGNVVIMWTPEELGDADSGTLEDVAITRGNDYLSEVPA